MNLSQDLKHREYLKKVGINQLFFRTVVRPRILEIHNHKCKDCNNEHNRMHIHHLSYEEQNINTLIPLCPSCHKKRHNYQKRNNINLNLLKGV